MEHKGYIYILANKTNTTHYIGVTNSLKRRLAEHESGQGSIFSRKYCCDKLVYFESFPEIEQAIAREKQLKRYKRSWKNELISAANPGWIDLG